MTTRLQPYINNSAKTNAVIFAASWRYAIAISEDGRGDWQTVSDQTQNTRAEQRRSHVPAAKVSGRFLRVTFIKVPNGNVAAISELEVLGCLAEK